MATSFAGDFSSDDSFSPQKNSSLDQVAIGELLVPELNRIREENREIKATLALTNKGLHDVNTHPADQSPRIEALGQKIDALREKLL